MNYKEREHLFRCMDKCPKVILLPLMMICLDHFEEEMNGDVSKDKNVIERGEETFVKTRHLIEEFSKVKEDDAAGIAKKLAQLMNGEL